MKSFGNAIRRMAVGMLLSAFMLSAAAADDVNERLRRLIADGITYVQAEQYSEALDYFTDALKLAEKEGNARGVYISGVNIGTVLSYTRDFDNALYYYQKSYDAARKANDLNSQGMVLINIIGSYFEKKDVSNARHYNELFIKTPIDDLKLKHYYTLYNNALIARLEKKYDLARYYCQEAIKQLPNGTQSKGLNHQIDLGDICMDQGLYDEAIALYKAAADSAKASGLHIYVRNACEQLAEAYEKKGDKEQADYYKQRALAESDTLFNQQQLNFSKSRLTAFERDRSQRHIKELSNSLNISLVIIAFVALLLIVSMAFLFVIRRKNQTLQASYELLIEKNNDLSKQAEQSKTLREQYLAALEKAPTAPLQSPQGGEAANELTPLGGHSEASTLGGDARGAVGASHLNDEQMARLARKITSVMEDISVISNPDFNQAMLVQLTGSNSTYVSNVINTVFGKNFKTLLNEYRINEACRRLVDEERYGHLTIEAIYRELGFVSPTVFINAFKRVNGMTPSQYQKLAREKR